MALLPTAPEPDCWQLEGEDDASTPPTVARVLNTVGTRREWRRAGFPVLFDEAGEVRHVQRCGRTYRFRRVDDEHAARLPHCQPL
ncbi:MULTISPECIES: hypothetical protein [Anaeromyxobacter]|uniref:hypothetical protein n=1 Tax=Anaeromyxobacter TaxID=161492 RepID=UPI001F55DF5B|nr:MULTISPECIES: hypothetical protein [unclassified Anaeromyxobacter]